MTEQNESQREKLRMSHSIQVLPEEVGGASRMRKAQIKPELKLGVVGHTYSSSIPQAGKKRSSLRPAWVTSQGAGSKEGCGDCVYFLI